MERSDVAVLDLGSSAGSVGRRHYVRGRLGLGHDRQPEELDHALSVAVNTGGATLKGRAAPEEQEDRLGRPTLTALQAVLTQAPGLHVAALGVSGMAESGVLLGPDDAPLAPIIAWHDMRDQAEQDRLEADLGRRAFSAATGLPSGTQWTITKHGWLQAHQPETRRARRWLNVPEWVVHRLGGDQGCEPSLASRTGRFNLCHRDWWRPGLAWSGIDTNLFPPLAPAGTPLGRAGGLHVPSALAGAVLTVAGHDHQVAAVGLGAAGAGDAVDSCGTANALLRTVRPTLPESTIVSLTDNGITVGWHVMADRWCLLGDTRSGLMLGRVLDRLRSGGHDLPDLDAAANSVAADRYEPLLGANLLAAEAEPAVLWRAALEAAALGTAEVREVMARHVGQEAKLVATGGWARDDMLLAIKRRLLGPIEHLEVGESGCRGAALFAGTAAGLYGSVDQFPRPTIVKGAV